MGPGVGIGAVLMGVVTKMVLPYDWTWNMVMVFGSILAATDTVAVLSLLKSANASPKLTILIVGESLLNDGTAIVLFTIFFNALNGQVYTTSSIVSFGFSAVFGSLLVGLLFGFAAVRWLRSAHRPLKEIDITIQIAITVCTAYLSFFAAQYTEIMSGPLATCFAGLILSWLAPPIILSHETMHNVWGMMEWFLNTLIFLLAGLITGHRVLEKTRPMDWFYLFVLYALLMGVRAVTLFILFPVLSRIGHKCTVQEAVFMSWGGLRGAVGMMLGLIVEKGGPNDFSHESSILFFYVGGIVALTFFINATTAKALLSYLGLMGSESPEKQLVMTQIKKKLGRKIGKLIEKMAIELDLSPADVEEVRNSCTLLHDEDLEYDLSIFNATNTSALLLAASQRRSRARSAGNASHVYSRVDIGTGSDDEPDDSFNSSAEGGSRRGHVSMDAASHSRRNQSPTLEVGRASEENDNSSYFSGATRNSRRSGAMSGKFSVSRTRNHSVATMRVQHLSIMLNMSHRGRNPALMQELLVYVRGIFLEIVRVRYWFHIEGGKLPRLSHSAQYLLYSVEVGIDEVSHEEGCRDWKCVKRDLDQGEWLMEMLSGLENHLPDCCLSLSSKIIGRLESKNEKRAVYMLTSFIEAHEHAQRKIHEFIGVEEDDEEDDEDDDKAVPAASGAAKTTPDPPKGPSPDVLRTPEEIRVVNESRMVVARARSRLQGMTPSTVTAIRSKQAVRLVLAKQAETVKHMVLEGLITPDQAEEILEEVTDDTNRLEKDRNRMYRELAKNRSTLRHEERTKSICDDEQVLQRNYELKLKNDDYKDIDPVTARADFMSRVKAYEKVYETINDDEDSQMISYIKLINVGQKVITRNCHGYLPSQVAFYLQNVHLSPRKIFLSVIAESVERSVGTENLSGSESGVLTKAGQQYAVDLAAYVKLQQETELTGLGKEVVMLTGTSRIHHESVSEFHSAQYGCFFTPLLNELRGGDMHGLSKAKMKELYPVEWEKRLQDKLTYRYPGVGGESYMDVIERIRPVIIELERQRRSIVIVCHVAVLRCIHAYFMDVPIQDLPVNDLLPHHVYELTPGPFGCTCDVVDPRKVNAKYTKK
eukprot:gene22554-28687_t